MSEKSRRVCLTVGTSCSFGRVDVDEREDERREENDDG